MGGTEIDAVIQGQRDLPVRFTSFSIFLRLKIHLLQDLESIAGFFIHPDNEYLIDKTNMQIRFEDKII